jgi:uncharacterized protein YndB with AHSA1/START domain
MAVQVEESINIAGPPGAVWRFLVDPKTWRLWWPGLLEADTEDHRPLREGSRLLLHVQPAWLAWRVRAQVDVAAAGKTLIWSNRSGLLRSRHAWYLEEKEAGTRVIQREIFEDGGAWLLRLSRQLPAIHEMFRRDLRGLKKMTETAS